LRLKSGYSSLSGNLKSGAVMPWRLCSRSIAIGGICWMAMVALVAPANAQAQQADDLGFWGTASAPLWARPYLFSGFNGSSLATTGSAYTTKLGSGTVGMFVESYGGQGNGGWTGSGVGNYFSSTSSFPTSPRENWLNAGDPAWRTSVIGYKSEPNANFSGIYTTASFGLTNLKTSPLGITGLTNFSGGDAAAMTASAGLGVKLTPNLTLEGSVSFTQVQPSGFR
jgi:hypothetical protein